MLTVQGVTSNNRINLFSCTGFNYYTIKEGIRPDMVAQELYDNPELDWVVLTSANIINVRVVISPN